MKQGKNPAQQVRAGASGLYVALTGPARALPSPASVVGLGAASNRILAALLLSFTLAGCTHKTHWAPPNTALSPVDLEPVPEPLEEPTFAYLPPPELDLPETTELPKRPVRRRPTPSPAPGHDPSAVQAPTQIAAAAPDTAELAIGSLSSGGDATPQAQQQARDLIAAIEKRVAALPRSAANRQKPPLRQVTSFLKQAQQALDSGDAEGAVNLATKARLLMDDIEKK